MADDMDMALEDAQLLESMENMEGCAEVDNGKCSSQDEQAAEAANSTAADTTPPSASNSTPVQHAKFTEIPAVARKPPLARKRVITAKLVTPVQTQDAGALTSGEAVAETQAPTPKAPSKSITPIDQDVLQAIVAAVDRIESNDGSKASKSNNSETSGKLAAGKVAKGGPGKENTKPAAKKNKATVTTNKPRKKSEKPRMKSAYTMFCAAQRPIIKGERPSLSMTDVTKEVAALWRAKTADEKKTFQDDAEAANALQQEEFAASGLNDHKKASSDAGHKKKAKSKGGQKPSKNATNSRETQQAEDSDDFHEDAANAEESGDDSDRECRQVHFQRLLHSFLCQQNCDWELHPAEAIIAATAHHKFIVKRKGLDLTEYGLVDTQACKRQRQEANVKTPISLQQLEEFEAWERNFKQSVRENTDKGSLELDNLGKESPLESCYYLGKMLVRPDTIFIDSPKVEDKCCWDEMMKNNGVEPLGVTMDDMIARGVVKYGEI